MPNGARTKVQNREGKERKSKREIAGAVGVAQEELPYLQRCYYCGLGNPLPCGLCFDCNRYLRLIDELAYLRGLLRQSLVYVKRERHLYSERLQIDIERILGEFPKPP